MKFRKSLIAVLLTTGVLYQVANSAPSIAPTIQPVPMPWDSNTTVVNGTTQVLVAPWKGGGKITSCSYNTGTGSFIASLKINGVSVTGCSSLSVSSSSVTTATATAANTFVFGDVITWVITSASGSPNAALVQFTIQTTAN